jgi:hypothetical protein
MVTYEQRIAEFLAADKVALNPIRVYAIVPTTRKP